jgi:hypothetical protein
MKLYRTLTVTVGLLLALAAPSFAQTTLTSTTLAAAASATASSINVASATGIEVGDRVAILARNRVAEFARVTAINGTFISVSRGLGGRVVGHLSGATVYHAPEAQFYSNDPVVGTACTRSAELYLPHINRSNGTITQCSTASVWYRLDETFAVECYTGALATGSVDQTCWTANGNYVIVGITYVSKVVEAGGTLTVIPRRQQGTEAPASGDSLATAISGVSTVAETVTSFTLTTTGTDLLLDAGDRLGLDFTDDVAGELLGVVVTFTLAPI